LIARGAPVDVADTILGQTPLFVAAQYGRPDAVARLLGAGAAVDGADKEGRTPLHAAAAAGHVDVVERLLAKGADPGRTDAAGRTAFVAALTNISNEAAADLLAGAREALRG
jgi:ankyrin repeat protein